MGFKEISRDYTQDIVLFLYLAMTIRAQCDLRLFFLVLWLTPYGDCFIQDFQLHFKN